MAKTVRMAKRVIGGLFRSTNGKMTTFGSKTRMAVGVNYITSKAIKANKAHKDGPAPKVNLQNLKSSSEM